MTGRRREGGGVGGVGGEENEGEETRTKTN